MDWEAKIRKLERILARKPRSRLFLPLAEAHRELGHYGRATELFQMGVQFHPGYTRARIGLARALLLMGRIEEARRELHQVISLVPDNLMARRILAELHRKEGQPEQAAAEYRAILRHHPELEKIRSRSTLAGQLASLLLTRERPSMSLSSSKNPLSSGTGVAASRRIEHASLQSEPESEPPMANVDFDEAFLLPVLTNSAMEMTAERFLAEFFPGAFVIEVPQLDAVTTEPPIQTLSLVQLYLDQGFVTEARQMLEQILVADPGNQQAREKLQALRFAAAEEGSAQQVFKRWLEAIETVKRHRSLALLA